MASAGTMAVVPAMLVLVILNQKNAAQPAIIEHSAPVEFARRQYSPKTVGQKKTDSSPPKEKRFIQTISDGGSIAARNTSMPVIAVAARLITRIFRGAKLAAESFAK